MCCETPLLQLATLSPPTPRFKHSRAGSSPPPQRGGNKTKNPASLQLLPPNRGKVGMGVCAVKRQLWQLVTFHPHLSPPPKRVREYYLLLPSNRGKVEMGACAFKRQLWQLVTFHPHPSPPPQRGGNNVAPSLQQGEGWDGGLCCETPLLQLATLSPPP